MPGYIRLRQVTPVYVGGTGRGARQKLTNCKEGQAIWICSLSHAPSIRQAVPILSRVVEVDIVVVTSCRVGRVHHLQVVQAVPPDGDQCVHHHIRLHAVVKLLVPPDNKYVSDDVVQGIF